jgi:hypothetical protein
LGGFLLCAAGLRKSLETSTNPAQNITSLPDAESINYQ